MRWLVLFLYAAFSGQTMRVLAQCPTGIPDTTKHNAEHRYQDDFKFTYQGVPINQYSDAQGKVRYGPWYIFSKHGLVSSSGCYEFDLKQGWWKYYDRKGHLQKLIYYKHGQALCSMDLGTGKRKEHSYKEERGNATGFKLADSRFW
jgi:hypothetical protein